MQFVGGSGRGPAPSGASTPRPLGILWRDRRIGAAAAVGIAALAGALTAREMPYGPATRTQVVVAMVAGGLVGALAGLVVRSRWAMLLAPTAFTAAFELGRVHAVGLTVDAISFRTAIGTLSFMAGRGLHALTGLLPIVLGAASGAGLARRLAGVSERQGLAHVLARVSRRAVAALTVLALVALAVALGQPGKTARILGPDSRPLAGSIATLEKVRLGGHDQWVMLRGRSVDNPVLLYLAGGPGQSDLGYVRAYLSEMERDFVFAVWDQRGAGKSYPALDPPATWTLDQAVADTIELAGYLRDRFGEQKVYLFGNSWGSTLGALAVQRRPDLFHAFIASGQMVSQRETDRILYRQMLTYAARTGDTALAAKLRGYGEPPYRDLLAYGLVIEYYDKLEPYAKTSVFERQGPAGIDGNGAEEYGGIEKVNKLRGLFDMSAVMYPQLQGLDLRRDVPRVGVPVYFLQGRHELSARGDLALDYFNRLAAPSKRLVFLEHSGHVPQFEEAARFQQILTDIILPETYPQATRPGGIR